MSKMQSLPSRTINLTTGVVKKSICKYNTRQNTGNAIRGVKTKLFSVLMGLQKIFIVDLLHFTGEPKLYTYYNYKVFASLS